MRQIANKLESNIITKRMENKMETYTFDDIKKEIYGEIGTPRRDKIEAELANLRIGLQIRNARKERRKTL